MSTAYTVTQQVLCWLYKYWLREYIAIVEYREQKAEI